MNRCQQGAPVPEWMTKGKTTLIQKDPSKRTAPNNYRPISCLTMMWKLLTAQITGIYLLIANTPWIVPWLTERMLQKSRCPAELLYRDQHILNESKTRRKNLAMAWIDFKNVYDVVLQRWIINCLKMYKITDKVINFIEKTMKTWRVDSTSGGRS